MQQMACGGRPRLPTWLQALPGGRTGFGSDQLLGWLLGDIRSWMKAVGRSFLLPRAMRWGTAADSLCLMKNVQAAHASRIPGRGNYIDYQTRAVEAVEAVEAVVAVVVDGEAENV